MIKPNLQSAVHNLIIYDLAIRTLNYNLPTIEELKTGSIYKAYTESLLIELRKDYKPLKQQLMLERISIVKWQQVDQFFSDVIVSTSGNDQSLRYAKKVLQYEVDSLLNKIALRLVVNT